MCNQFTQAQNEEQKLEQKFQQFMAYTNLAKLVSSLSNYWTTIYIPKQSQKSAMFWAISHLTQQNQTTITQTILLTITKTQKPRENEPIFCKNGKKVLLLYKSRTQITIVLIQE